MLRDLIQDTFSFIQDSIVGESQYSDALDDHIGVAILIVMPLLSSIVRRAVALNDQMRFTTIEVSYIIAKLMLPSEF